MGVPINSYTLLYLYLFSCSPRCLIFGHWLTLGTLKIGLLIYLLNCLLCRYLRHQLTDISLQITSVSSVIGGNNTNSTPTSVSGSGASFQAHKLVVSCYSPWLHDQIINKGHWCVGEVVYLDEICRTSKMTAATFHTLLDFMYTGRTNFIVNNKSAVMGKS